MFLNGRGSMLWLGAGLALTSATQLRIPGSPLGLGELMLAAWAAGSAGALLMGVPVTRWSGLREILVFWMVVAAALAGGLAFAVLTHRDALPLGRAAHDSLAFTFVAATLVLMTAPAGAAARLKGAWARMIPVLVVPLVVLAAGRRPVGPVQPWDGFRFRGWSTNPNQTALVLVLIPFVGFALARELKGPRARAWTRACTLLAIPLGVLTASDALFLAWLAGGALVGGVAWLHMATGPAQGVWNRAMAWFIVPGLLVLGLVTAGPTLAALADARAMATYNEQGQGSTRVSLWTHGAQAWAASPLVGLGPGGHSGYLGPFLHEEAHNTFIDFGSSTGLLGLAAYLTLLGAAARRLVRSRRPALVAGLAALVTYSMFHYVLRHPVFWTGLLVLMLLARGDDDDVPAAAASAAPVSG
jgi:O-antigen ligase